MEDRNKKIREMEQIEEQFENVASPFEFEKLQESFDRMRFEVIDVADVGNGEFFCIVLCLGFQFFFGAHMEQNYAVIDLIESIELPHDNNFNSEKAEREFAGLDVFLWEAQ